jgi:serine/threonine protein kinase
MSTVPSFDEELVRRLPLPLAQLYRRADNAKTALERHNAAFCLWEAALKLLASVAIVAYTERGQSADELDDRLQNLARPALGHWWEFVRLLVPLLADTGDEGFSAVRELVLGRTRDDLPRSAGLDAALREALDEPAGARTTVRLTELFDWLVRYRNRELGHGAPGLRSRSFYDQMGPALLLAVAELLGRIDVLAGRRLIAITDVRRQTDGSWLIERYELRGEAPRRLESAQRHESEAEHLPRPERLYLDRSDPKDDGEPAALWSLHPLVLYIHESNEVFFLNARRGMRRVEYLCYSPGRTIQRDDLADERRALLAKVLKVDVNGAQAEAWAAQSQAEEPPLPAVAAEASPARRLGEFELMSELGQGGMGIVYRAWQPSLGRQVALKCLLRAGDPKAEARFNREIRALGRVEHPNLVKVFTSGSEADRWFYAMELVEGATLAAVCDRLQGSGSGASDVDLATWHETLSTACRATREAERPLSDRSGPDPHTKPTPGEVRTTATAKAPASGGRDYIRHVVDLVGQVARAADALHEAGVIHRDIKPDNILVTPDGTQAVLMDLGLAQLADDIEGRLTRTRQFVGTLRYASPEQVLSVPLDRRSDVYSLGATLWELLTLQPLFGATQATPTPELMLKVQSADPEAVRRLNPRVPADLEAVVLKCLEKDRSRRYGTAAEFADDLDRWLRSEPVHAQPPTLGYMLGKYLRRHRTGVLTGSLALVLIVAASAGGLYLDGQRRRQARKFQSDQRAQAQAHREQLRQSARADETLARNELRADRFASAEMILSQAIERLRGETALAALAARLDSQRESVHHLVEFTRIADEAERLEEMNYDTEAEEACEAALRHLSIVGRERWWDHLPASDLLDRGQIVQLQQEAYRQLLLLAGIRAKWGLTSFRKSEAADAFQRALEIVAPARKFRPDDRSGQLIELFCHDRLGQSDKVHPMPPGEPQSAVDYYFLGVLHLFVNQSPDDPVTKFLVARPRELSGLDFKTPLTTAEQYFRSAATLMPRHY